MTHAMTYWSISSKVLTEEAELLGLNVDIINKDKNLYYIYSSSKKILFKTTDFWENSALWFKLCNNKELTYNILEKNSFPIAKSYYIIQEDFKDFKETDIQNFRYPLIIKPHNEGHWNGVMMNIENFEELSAKLCASFEEYGTMIIQELAKWDEARVVVIKWEVVLAFNRIPAQIIWDGILKIWELIQKENLNPMRWDGYNNLLSNIEIDDELLSYIDKQWYNLDTILKDLEVVQLRWNSNTGTWGTLHEVTSILSDDTKKICCEIAELFWLSIAWIDLIMKDFSKDLSDWNGIILEVNASPWIWWHRELTSVNTGRIILKKIFNIA